MAGVQAPVSLFWMVDWDSWGTEKEPFGNIHKGHRREDGDSLVVELCSSSSGEVDVNFRLMWVRYSHEHSSSPYIIKNKVLEKKSYERWPVWSSWVCIASGLGVSFGLFTLNRTLIRRTGIRANSLGFHCPPSKEQCPVVNPQQLYKNSHVIFEH